MSVTRVRGPSREALSAEPANRALLVMARWLVNDVVPLVVLGGATLCAVLMITSTVVVALNAQLLRRVELLTI